MKTSSRFFSLSVLFTLAVGAVGSLTCCNADDEKALKTESAAQTEAAPVGDAGKPVAVTEDMFDEIVLKSDKLVLVDFWAEWCQPCLIIAPEVKKVAKKYADNVLVVKVDFTEDPRTDLGERMGVQILPALLIIKDGKVLTNLIENGSPMPNAEKIGKALEKHL